MELIAVQKKKEEEEKRRGEMVSVFNPKFTKF